MTLTRDSKCPLCGSGMTDFHDSHSDGESIRCGILRNQCVNHECGLPVKFWDTFSALKSAYDLRESSMAELSRLRQELEVKWKIHKKDYCCSRCGRLFLHALEIDQ